MRLLKWFALGFVVLLAVVLVVGGYVAARIFRVDPGLAVRDVLTGYQRGSERHQSARSLPQTWDPFGDANRMIEEIPLEERSYPLLAEAFAVLEAAYVDEEIKRRPGDEWWDATVEWLDSDDGGRVSALVREAVARPHAGFPIGDGSDPTWEAARERAGLEPFAVTASDHPALIDALMPAVGAKNRLAMHLGAEARLAMVRGDRARFQEATLAIAGLSHHSYPSYSLIEHLVDLTVRRRLIDVVGEAMESDGFLTEPMAAGLDAALGQFDPQARLARGFEAEQVVFEDLIRRMVDENGVFVRSRAMRVMLETDTPQLNIEPSSVARESINEGLARALDEQEESLAAALRSAAVPYQPYGDFDAQVDNWKQGTDSIPRRVGKMMLGIMVPAITKVAATTRTAHQRQIAFRVALAAHRHRLRHGDPPLGISDIDQDLLAFDPVDGFTGGPLQLRWRDGGPLVYAYGPDLDDDGGVHLFDMSGDPVESITDRLIESKPDGDFVLFPAPSE